MVIPHSHRTLTAFLIHSKWARGFVTTALRIEFRHFKEKAVLFCSQQQTVKAGGDPTSRLHKPSRAEQSADDESKTAMPALGLSDRKPEMSRPTLTP
jgi:hypothetical protein